MSGESKNIEKLIEVLTESANQSKNLNEEHRIQRKEFNERMDRLADGQGQLTEQVNQLVKIQIQAQAWQEKHTEDKERLEKNQIDQGKRLDNYIQSNDERVLAVEKLLIRLDVDSTSNKKKLEAKEDGSKKIKQQVTASVITAAVLSVGAILWKIATA